MTGKRIRRMVGWQHGNIAMLHVQYEDCLLYTSPSPRDA